MKAPKKDELHQPVGQIFRETGWQTIDLSPLGNGLPDWLVMKPGRAKLLEVKSKFWRRPGSKTQQIQEAFRETWTACEVVVVETLEQAWAIAERKESE